MTSIIHISDTHFGTEVPMVVDALQKIIHIIQPDIIILSGDITQRARIPEFKNAAVFMASLPAKGKIAIPGNHDIPLFNIFSRFITPYHNYTQAFGTRENIWCNEDIGILSYDATSPLRHTRGKLSDDRILQQADTLKKKLVQGAILIACAHQPLVTAWPQDESETLIHREQTAKLWSKIGVDIVLSGHVHVPLITTTQQTFPNLPRHFVLVGAGTAISHRVRPGTPNSINLIKINKQFASNSISITQYNFDSELVQFVAMPSKAFHQLNQSWKEIKEKSPS